MIAKLDIPRQESAIQVIDISPWLDPQATTKARQAVIEALHFSCRTHGFFSLVGHGVSLDLQRQVLGCAETFFDMPMEDKMAVSMAKSMGMSNRGYEVLRGQTLQPDALPDLKEIGAEVAAEDSRAGKFLHGPNMWPSSLEKSDFQAPLMEYLSRLTRVAELLLEMLRQALPNPPSEDLFKEFQEKPSTNLRLLHYPPQVSFDERQLGAGAHTDFGGFQTECHDRSPVLTFAQPGAPGLEVWHPHTSTWIPVPAVEDHLVVNIGDLLNLWTNGYFLSAVHRVINRAPTDRYSAPFFYNGNTACNFLPLDMGLGPINTTVQTVEGHILGKLKATREKT
ncbi:hypothetical protein D6D03_08974 [Aureobasidium pullulans]|nr:hypothetical protein D6D03_08974 [Aureobasidium pullulans]